MEIVGYGLDIYFLFFNFLTFLFCLGDVFWE